MPVIALVELIQVATIVPMMNLLTGREGEISLGGIQIDSSLLRWPFSLRLCLSLFRFVDLLASTLQITPH